MKDDPFDSPFFREQREKHKERAKEQSAIRRWFGFGLAATLVIIVLNLLIYGAVVAVVLWVVLTILQHFGVLMLAPVALGAV